MESAKRTRRSSGRTLTGEQLQEIELKRKKAQDIRHARATTYAITQMLSEQGTEQSTKIVDTGGGFLLEEYDEPKEAVSKVIALQDCGSEVQDEAECTECHLPFTESFLRKNFDLLICNGCRDREGQHQLITKTDAKNKFCLKDCDLDRREPVLRYIRKKNPHHSQWGEMKLFLLSQVKRRAVEVWGSEDELADEKERREANKEKTKEKQFQKSINDLRRNVRASLYKKKAEGHRHEFGPETYDADDDCYSKTCTTCGHVQTYEKM